jgi:flavin-binding protein dodecin
VFDYRYHALSLAAVLLALALGVVIGVAIGDSSLVSSAKSGIVHELSSEVSGVQHQAGQLRAQLNTEEAFANDLYPLAVHELLSGRSIGLVFLGSSSNRVNALVRGAVTQAGGDLVNVVAVREPLDLAGIAHEAAGTRYAALGSSPSSSEAAKESGGSVAEGSTQLIERFGVVVGRQLVSGGANVNKEFINRVRGGLMSAFDGQLSRLEGLVVERADPTGMSSEQSQASAAFESGLIAGVAAARIPTVGVELSGTEPSQVPWYQGKGVSSVDDLDLAAGQVALIYALAGSHGAYGTKSTAESLLPNAAGASGQP